MASWAAIAAQPVQPTVSVQDLTRSTENLRVLVVDANAIIGGVRLDGIADRAVTVQEVLDEVRDKQSRQFLASLPFTIDVAEPTDESMAAVTSFARETGDAAVLSNTDLKVLALAHTLEVAAHGTQRLQQHPNKPQLISRRHVGSETLPGWGSVPNPEDWRVVDEADEAAGHGSSRIASKAQDLLADPTTPTSSSGRAAAGAGQQQQEGAEQQGVQQVQAAVLAATLRQQQQAAGAGGSNGVGPGPSSSSKAQPAAPGSRAHNQQQQQQEEDDEEESSEEEGQAGGGDSDGWEVAASSKTAFRRKRKKAARRQAWQAAFEAEWEGHGEEVAAAAAAAGQQGEVLPPQQQQQAANGLQQATNGLQAGSGEAAAAAAAGGEEGAGDMEGSEGEEETASEECHDEFVLLEDVVETAEDSHSLADSSAATGEAGGDGSDASPSSVAIITQDFAMQNVLLQMGLRLLTRAGQAVTRLRRWALRCPACYGVTKEAGRLFCPKCGNLGLERVEVRVGRGGAELYGISKRHVLRGTKYSLPKPRGGRNNNQPILREDIFLLKVKAMGRKAGNQRRPKAAEVEAAAAAGEGAGGDVYVPEGADSWQRSQSQLAQHRGLAAMLQPAWKKNPNEKRGPRKC